MDARQEARRIVNDFESASLAWNDDHSGNVNVQDLWVAEKAALVRIVAAAIDHEQAVRTVDESWSTDSVKATWRSEAELVAAVRAVIEEVKK